LLDTIVFGKIADAEAAARLSKQRTVEKGQDTHNQNGSDSEIFVVKEPILFRKEIQETMRDNAGIIREETRLQNGLKRILEIKEKFYSKDNVLKGFKIDDENVVLTWEVKCSLVVREASIRSALMRQESRGAHYRSDFPKLEIEKWKVNIYCRNQKEGQEMALFKNHVKVIDGPLANMIKEHSKPEHHREFE
jgi:succinate dehydrogenase / fumarate reductase, flavoprotein subunit